MQPPRRLAGRESDREWRQTVHRQVTVRSVVGRATGAGVQGSAGMWVDSALGEDVSS